MQHDLLRPNYSSFDACRQDEHDAGKMNVLSFLSQKLFKKNCFRKNGYFNPIPGGGGGESAPLVVFLICTKNHLR